MTKKVAGIFASDLDGTISFQGKEIDPSIVEFFESLENRGWLLLFATGRTLLWSLEHLKAIQSPYYIAPFNGASLWKKEETMSLEAQYSHTMTERHLDILLPMMQKYGAFLYQPLPREEVFMIDSSQSPRIVAHLNMRRSLQKECWNIIHDLSSVHKTVPPVCSVRIFFEVQEEKKMQQLVPVLAEEGMYSVIVKDSFNPDIRILQISPKIVNKKTALEWLHEKYLDVPIVAMGDDHNDLPMFTMADRSIAIFGASHEVVSFADIITQNRSGQAIVLSAQEAIKSLI